MGADIEALKNKIDSLSSRVGCICHMSLFAMNDALKVSSLFKGVNMKQPENYMPFAIAPPIRYIMETLEEAKAYVIGKESVSPPTILEKGAIYLKGAFCFIDPKLPLTPYERKTTLEIAHIIPVTISSELVTVPNYKCPARAALLIDLNKGDLTISNSFSLEPYFVEPGELTLLGFSSKKLGSMEFFGFSKKSYAIVMTHCSELILKDKYPDYGTVKLSASPEIIFEGIRIDGDPAHITIVSIEDDDVRTFNAKAKIALYLGPFKYTYEFRGEPGEFLAYKQWKDAFFKAVKLFGVEVIEEPEALGS